MHVVPEAGMLVVGVGMMRSNYLVVMLMLCACRRQVLAAHGAQHGSRHRATDRQQDSEQHNKPDANSSHSESA
jgi:hypothetical protein